MSCNGRGECLEQIGLDKYINTGCSKNCQVVKCQQCQLILPQWVIDCNYGTCVNCAAENYCNKEKEAEDPK
jgi:hypothetical protein